MTIVVGKTSNGFTYEGEYEPAGHDSVRWTATFRQQGDYHGMRHGRIFEVSRLSLADLDVVVKNDIDEIWVKEH